MRRGDGGGVAAGRAVAAGNPGPEAVGNPGPEAVGNPGPEATGPVRGKEDERPGHHQPWENAQPGEQDPGHQVKGGQGEVGGRAGAPPQQGGYDGQVKEGAGPAHGVGGPDFGQEWPGQGDVAVLVEPDAQGEGVEQPVRVQLGDAGEYIDYADLEAQSPQRPARRRRVSPRQEDQQEADQAHPVIVVQVGGAVNQLNIGEADKEQRAANPAAIPCGDGEAQCPQRREVGIHSPAGPGLHPAKAEVGEVVSRRKVQILNPAVGEEPDDDSQPHQAEQDAESRE